jgi:predicted DNA-binding antitoxin AbrB/MazE fold protein
MDHMSKTIETSYRNGCIQLPDDVHLTEDTRVTVILPDDAVQAASRDSAYSIPDLASDIGPEDLARNLEHYLYGHSKQS